ncbi:VOC family protein [Lentzea sp.]|uniref:VOC family protein n=1 Tax=Lentzea sp. TaxID=56099 RepID=UPI002C823C8A|nr:VOC family protein [Lentzea sp.]HUQ54595.1 VOC family protein [Lentzea sp.]
MRSVAVVTVVVRDYDEAIRFYVDGLGFTLTEDVPQGDKRWVVVSADGGASLLLAQADTDHVGDQTGGRVGFFLHTDDFDRDHARMTAYGVKFLETPRDEVYGRVAVFEDLYGNRWDLLQPTRA